MKVTPRRALRINFIDGTYIDLEIEKAASINTSASMINIDKMKNGKWRLIWDEKLFKEFSSVKNLEMIREIDSM
jgi:hypothetical protein